MNSTVDGFKTIIDAVYRTNHAEPETAEITQGFNGLSVLLHLHFHRGPELADRVIISIATYRTTARRQQRDKVQHGAAECEI